MIWIIIGSLIIAAIFIALSVSMAVANSPRTALSVFGLAIFIVAIVTGASLMISYGVQGYL